MSKQILSRAEKRARLLEIFHETQSFYQLKDLEQLAKEKGLNVKQVKEILQSLVDDEQVDSDRIGPSNFYWSFTNKLFNTKLKKVDEMKDTKLLLSDKLGTLAAALKSEQVRHAVQTMNVNSDLELLIV